MTRRSGLSLVEVLTALFILAFGTIAILTMFPLGAIQMAQAVRDDRSTTAAFSADNYFRTYWKTNIAEELKKTNPNYDPFFDALTNPNAGLTGAIAKAPANVPLAKDGQVSYPVAIDPMGQRAPRPSLLSNSWIGDNGDTNMPRRSLRDVTSNAIALRLCSSMDGLGYTEDGVPNERELRYNFLWVVQCPNVRLVNGRNANPAASLTVVVFDRRAHLYAPTGSEIVQAASVQPGAASVTLTSVQDIKPGAWIMDATVSTAPLLRHANFYQVTAVNYGTNTVELQSPIKKRSDGSDVAYPGTFVIMRGVSGVFERPPLTGD